MKDPKITHRQAGRGSRRRRHARAVRPREGRRGLASDRHERVDGREPVPPRRAEALGRGVRRRHQQLRHRRRRRAAHRRRGRRGARATSASRSPSSSAAATSGAACPGATRGMDRARADYMGMLATVINALALQDCARGGRAADARADRDHDGAGRRALHPAAGDPSPREGPGRGVRRRHRQPVLHHRHHRRAARGRDRRARRS